MGNGPSLRAQDLDKIAGEITFGANMVYKIFDRTRWRPTYYVSVDKNFLIDFDKEAAALDLGCKFVNYDVKRRLRHVLPDAHGIYIKKSFPIVLWDYHLDQINDDASKYLNEMRMVTCTSLQLAFYMGFREIYLIGMDHNFAATIDSNGKKKVDPTIQPYFYETNISQKGMYVGIDMATSAYILCKKYADANGIQVYNATRGGKLEVFPRVEFDSLF